MDKNKLLNLVRKTLPQLNIVAAFFGGSQIFGTNDAQSDLDFIVSVRGRTIDDIYSSVQIYDEESKKLIDVIVFDIDDFAKRFEDGYTGWSAIALLSNAWPKTLENAIVLDPRVYAFSDYVMSNLKAIKHLAMRKLNSYVHKYFDTADKSSLSAIEDKRLGYCLLLYYIAENEPIDSDLIKKVKRGKWSELSATELDQVSDHLKTTLGYVNNDLLESAAMVEDFIQGGREIWK